MKKIYSYFGLLLCGLLLIGCGTIKSEPSKEAKEAAMAANRAKVKEKIAKQHEKVLEKLAPIHEEVKNYFYYSQLTEAEQKTYRRLVYVFRKDEDEDVKIYGSDVYSRAFTALSNDMPEFYWLAGSEGGIEYSKETYKQLQEVADSIVAQIPAGSEYDRVKYIYEYIINNTQYNTPALTNDDLLSKNQDIRSVLLEHLSVCAGYARTFQLLCQKAGIESIFVVGDTPSADISHAWNLVKIDGQYYPVDTTWGDPVFENEAAGGHVENVLDYAFLCMPKAIFERTHTAWSGYYSKDGNDFIWPEVSSNNTLNYYFMKGSYFETYDQSQIADYITNHAGESTIEMQFGSQEALDAALADIDVEGSFIHAYWRSLPNYSGYRFQWSANSLVLKLYAKQ